MTEPDLTTLNDLVRAYVARCQAIAPHPWERDDDAIRARWRIDTELDRLALAKRSPQ
jgi:hypothetical protein